MPWQPSERYPDPSIVALDPSFRKYHLALSAVERLWTGSRWGEGPVWLHHGIYGFRRPALERFTAAKPSPLEIRERLEQLRALENGIGIAVVKVDYDSIGVDVPEDVARVEAILKKI